MTDYVSVLLYHVPVWCRMTPVPWDRRKNIYSLFVLCWDIYEQFAWQYDWQLILMVFFSQLASVTRWNLLLLVTLFSFKSIYYILTLGDWKHCWHPDSLLLHYLNLIVIITCTAGLMITNLATALTCTQVFPKSSEVIDIVSNVVRNNRAGGWCVFSTLNLNKASMYK